MTDKTDLDIGALMSKEIRYLMSGIMTLLMGIGAPIVYLQWQDSLKTARMETQTTAMQMSIAEMGEDIRNLTNSFRKVVENDVSDLKSRIMVMEQKQILPGAERDIAEIQTRIREIEGKLITLSEKS